MLFPPARLLVFSLLTASTDPALAADTAEPTPVALDYSFFFSTATSNASYDPYNYYSAYYGALTYYPYLYSFLFTPPVSVSTSAPPSVPTPPTVSRPTSYTMPPSYGTTASATSPTLSTSSVPVTVPEVDSATSTEPSPTGKSAVPSVWISGGGCSCGAVRSSVPSFGWLFLLGVVWRGGRRNAPPTH